VIGWGEWLFIFIKGLLKIFSDNECGRWYNELFFFNKNYYLKTILILFF
jgi:hypothetical protein